MRATFRQGLATILTLLPTLEAKRILGAIKTLIIEFEQQKSWTRSNATNRGPDESNRMPPESPGSSPSLSASSPPAAP